jgi:hypothetical protein
MKNQLAFWPEETKSELFFTFIAVIMVALYYFIKATI